MINVRTKGANFERQIRTYIKDTTGWLVINPARMGFDGTDADLGWMNIEIKNQVTCKMPDWMRQAQGDSTSGNYAVAWKRKGKGLPESQLLTLPIEVATCLGIEFPEHFDFGHYEVIDDVEYMRLKKTGLQTIEEMIKPFVTKRWMLRTRRLNESDLITMELSFFLQVVVPPVAF